MANLIDDVVIRSPFFVGAVEESMRKSAYLQSGMVTTSPELSAQVGANKGRIWTTDYWVEYGDPDDTEPGSAGTGPTYPDDSTTELTLGTLVSGTQQVHKNGPVMGWGVADITNRFSNLPDPVQAVSSMVGNYWARYYDLYIDSILQGVLADNEANDSGDMVNDIGNASVAPAAGNSASVSAAIDTILTMGDAMDRFSGVTMHSVVWGTLEKLEAVKEYYDPTTQSIVRTFLGRTVRISDSVTIDTGGANPLYNTYFWGPGAFMMGSSNEQIIPLEIDRNARTGKGAGDTALISRVQFAIAPTGISWTDTTVTGSVGSQTSAKIYPKRADLVLAANWNRVASDRKHVPIAVLRSNA